MFAKNMYNPESFHNVIENGETTGFSFDFKIQYYRGITLSIIRDIKVNVDGEDFSREQLRFSVKGETFTLDEMRTVVDHELRWDFGEWATVTVLKPGGLSQGKHHINSMQVIAPSYMPHILENAGELEFIIK